MAAALWQVERLWPLPANPYVNHTPVPDAKEKLKWALVGLTLFLPRLVLCITTILVAWLVALLTAAGWPRGKAMRVDTPMSETSWRRRIQWVTLPYLCRFNLFALGFHHIRITGKEASRKEAPILVCNHTGFPDIWYFLWRCLPVGVSAAENLRFPVISDLMLSQQTIFVDREDRDSAQKASDMINAIARDDRWPQLVVYPEGNVANGRQLCAFKAGPFQPGLPVQPLVLSYQRNWGRLDPSWCDPLGGQPHLLAVRMMLQWHNYMEATYLPVMTPTAEEVKQPQLFAARVKAAMAAALNVPCTEFNFADARLTFAARKHKLPVDSVVLEMDRATREWGITYADARDALDRFAAAGGPGAMALNKEQLLAALRLGASDVTPGQGDALMRTFAQTDKVSVTYREFVAALAPLAKAAPKSGEPGFVARCVGVMKAKHLR